MSMVLMRFIWSMPLKFKRKFVKAIDDHLSWRSPAAMMARRGRKCCSAPKGRYAVMAIVEVARQSDARPISLGDIASRLELSLAYLEQLFMKLRRKGLVSSIRGPAGVTCLGAMRTRSASAKSWLPWTSPSRMTRCLSEGDGCVASRRCNTHFLWDALGAHIEQFLATATLADVLRGRYSAPAARFSLSELAAAAKVGS